MTRPWWQAVLPELEQELRGYLTHRLPSRIVEHDNLVNQTLMALSRWMSQHEDKRLATTPNSTEADDRRVLSAVAKVILTRRIADRFRLDAREWSHRVDLGDDALADLPLEVPPIERRILHRRMLEIVIGVLATMTAEDRDLIAFVSTNTLVERTLTPRERQRLHRARGRLKNAIVAAFGETATALLRDDA